MFEWELFGFVWRARACIIEKFFRQVGWNLSSLLWALPIVNWLSSGIFRSSFSASVSFTANLRSLMKPSPSLQQQSLVGLCSLPFFLRVFRTQGLPRGLLIFDLVNGKYVEQKKVPLTTSESLVLFFVLIAQALSSPILEEAVVLTYFCACKDFSL